MLLRYVCNEGDFRPPWYFIRGPPHAHYFYNKGGYWWRGRMRPCYLYNEGGEWWRRQMRPRYIYNKGGEWWRRQTRPRYLVDLVSKHDMQPIIAVRQMNCCYFYSKWEPLTFLLFLKQAARAVWRIWEVRFVPTLFAHPSFLSLTFLSLTSLQLGAVYCRYF
jgi:hypothetical protein